MERKTKKKTKKVRDKDTVSEDKRKSKRSESKRSSKSKEKSKDKSKRKSKSKNKGLAASGDRIILKDKIYVPIYRLDEEQAVEEYTHHMFDDKACRGCEHKPSRPVFDCQHCPRDGFKGTVRTCTDRKVIDGDRFIGFPIGDRTRVEKRLNISFDDFEIEDKRVRKKFRYPVRMRKNFKLRDYQEKAKKKWRKMKHGLIVAPPRSGKTPTMLDLCIDLGYRTIILANQHDFLKQFLEHIEDFTNLPALERKHGKKLYGYAKKPEDFDDLEICLCTYQQFISDSPKARKRFRAARKNFGTLFVDEVHRANADTFAAVINKFPAKYKGGVTGTDKRKDKKEFIVREMIGPVTHRVQIPQLRAAVSIDLYDAKPRSQFKGPAGWTYANKWIANQEPRTEAILKKIGKDLKNGRSIVIPCYFKEQIYYLVKRINDLYGAKTAEAFVGGGGEQNKRLREGIIDRAREGTTRVVVGTRSLVQLGINIPKWDTLYVIAPISNEPNWKQESSRILTPMDDKNKPLIRFWVDIHVGQSLGCFCTTYRQTLKFGHAPTKKARDTAMDLLALQSGKGSSADFDPGVESKPTRDKSIWGR